MCVINKHLIGVICVLLLNLQVFGANAMGCVHQAETGHALSGCPHAAGAMPATVADDPAASAPVDEPCQKCNLMDVAAAWHLVPPPVAQPVTSAPAQVRSSVTPVMVGRAADDLLRPPRSPSA
jgi:hypothetical protein